MIQRASVFLLPLLLLGSPVVPAGTAFADDIPLGTYKLFNRPGLFQYGLRLDALGTLIDNAGSNQYPDSAPYTFDVSGMTMTYSADDRIRISGPATGGFGVVVNWTDTEGWFLDMTYENVARVPSDDDLWVVNASDGVGTITRDNGGQVFALAPKSNGQFVFRLGDGESEGKGPDGIVGSGWLTVNGEHGGTNDFLFMASSVPDGGYRAAESGVALLAMLGFAGLLRLRSRKRA